MAGDKRVIHRMGARELTQEELAKVNGSANTLLSVIITNTSSGFDEHHDS